jgi:MFS family permease
LVSLYLQTFIYTPWSAPDRQIHEGWWRHYSGLARERPYFVFLLFTAVLTFLLNVTGPFVPVFMHYHLGLDVVAQTKFVLLGNLASALAIGYWGRLCDRYGCKPVIATTAMLWMASSCLWAVVTPALSWILYPMWLWGGMTSGGVVLGIFNLLLKLVPAKARTAAISVHLMATSVAAALAPVLVGTLLGAAARGSAEQLHLYRLLFVLQPCALLLSLLILAQVAEPQAQGLSSVIGALRTLRQTLLHNGYMVLANVVLMRGRRSRGR